MSRTHLYAGAAAVLGAGYALLRCGFGVYPGTGVMLEITRDLPTIEPLAPLAQTFQFSPLGPVLGYAVGADDRASYLALHATILVLGCIALTWYVARRWSPTVAIFVSVTFLTSQACVVSLAWTGSYDVFTVLLGSTVVIVASRRVAAAAGFVAAFAVFEQIAISLAVLAVVAHLVGDDRRDRFLAGLGGAVVGRVVLTVVLRANGVTHDRREWFDVFGVSHFLRQFGDAWPLLVVTGLGGAGLIVGACLGVGVGSWKHRIVWIAALVVPVIPTALTEDQTRVYAMLTWPIVLALVTSTAPRFTVHQMRTYGAGALVLGLVIPPVFLWRGEAFLADHHIWRLIS